MKRKRLSWVGSDLRKRKALSKAIKVILNTSDKSSDINIVDPPTEGQVSGCHQLSVPARFPEGEEDSNPDTAIETSYHMPRQANQPKNRCGCCGRAAIEKVGNHHVCNGGKCWLWANTQLNKTAEFGQGLTQLTTEQETGKVKQRLTEPARWNESYHDENQFEDKDLKLGTPEPDDTDPLSSSVYPPYTDGIGQPNPRYEDASPKQRNIILHATEDQATIDPNQGPKEYWIAVDLDGTILEPPAGGIYQDPSGQHMFGNPLPRAGEVLQKLIDQGVRISIYTARQYFTHNDEEENTLRDAVQDVLDQHQIPYSDVYIGNKPPSNIILDDRAIQFTDWESALSSITDKMDKVASGDITIDDIEIIYEYYYKISRLEDKKVDEGLSEEGAANIREMSVVLSKLLKLAIEFMKNKVYGPWMKSTSTPDQTAIPEINAARHNVAATLRELAATGNIHRDMAIFSQALNTAHSSGSMMDFLSHWYNIDAGMLSALTSGEGYIERWDRDLKRVAGEDFGIHDIEMIYEMFYKISKLEDQQTEQGISERGNATLTEMKHTLSQLLRKAIVFLRDGVYNRWLETRGKEATNRSVVDRIQNVAKMLVPSGDINRDIALFGNALNVVHQTGPMVEFVERWYGISALALEGLSMGTGYTERWDRDIKRVAEDDEVKDQKNYQGIKIDIEWPKGSIRSYEGDDTYVTHMKCSYGYARGIKGADDEGLDIYLCDGDSDTAFVIEQLKDDGSYDEDKIVLGCQTEAEAADMYLQHMPAYMIGDIRAVPVEKLVNALYGEPEDRRGEEDLVPSEEINKAAQKQVITRTETIENKIDVCPHCNQDIHEKSLYWNDGKWYHRGCVEAGPIEFVKTEEEKDRIAEFAQWLGVKQASGMMKLPDGSGFFTGLVGGDKKSDVFDPRINRKTKSDYVGPQTSQVGGPGGVMADAQDPCDCGHTREEHDGAGCFADPEKCQCEKQPGMFSGEKDEITKKPNYLFVYGTLRQGEPYYEKFLADSKFVKTVKTQPKYHLVITQAAGMVPGESAVEGELYEVPDHVMDEIDRYEHPYYRQEIELDDGTKANAYFVPEEVSDIVEEAPRMSEGSDVESSVFPGAQDDENLRTDPVETDQNRDILREHDTERAKYRNAKIGTYSERPKGCYHYWRDDNPCESCQRELEWNNKETGIIAKYGPCHWCGSDEGYEDVGDGWSSCKSCHGT